MTETIEPVGADIRRRLEDHEEYFVKLVNTIPAKIYLPKSENSTGGWVKFGHNKKQIAPKQDVKEGSKRAKKQRLDPDAPKSVADIQKQRAEAEENGEEHEDSSERNVADEDSAKSATEHQSLMAANSRDSAKTPDELRQKLAERIAQLRGKRGSSGPVTDAPATKRPKKEKKKKEVTASLPREQQRAHVKARDASGTGASANGEGEIVYSKFDFSALEKKAKHQKKKDLKHLLAKAEDAKNKLSEMKATNPEKANEIMTKQQQKKALDMARGIKQKDDPSLLKKSIKRVEKKKEKSKKAWNAREKQVRDDLKKKQKKRDENIQARIQNKKEKRMNRGKKPAKKASSKGRPGFEGKKRL